MKLRPVWYILVFFVTGCHNSNDTVITYEDFPLVENIGLTPINLPDTIFLRYPHQMAKSDSLFFILDLHAPDYFVHCFSYPNFDPLHSLFQRGEGPGEYLQIKNIQFVKDTLWAYSSTNEIYFITRQNLASEDPVIGKIKLANNFGFLNGGVKIDANFYFPVFSILHHNRILTFDNQGNFISAFGELKQKRELDAATNQAWIPFLGGNETILAAATQFGEVIDIYSLKNDNQQLTIKGKGDFPRFQNHNGYAIPNGILGFEDIQVTKNYIIAVYNGESMKERKEARQGGQYLYVYNFKGIPVKKIILDQFISSIQIDEEENVLYALTVNLNQPLFMVNLSDCID